MSSVATQVATSSMRQQAGTGGWKKRLPRRPWRPRRVATRTTDTIVVVVERYRRMVGLILLDQVGDRVANPWDQCSVGIVIRLEQD